MTRVIGRDALLDEVCAALAQSHVVLSGPAGVGKTTLARCAAERGADAVFCDLTAARTADDLRAAVAAALGLDPLAGVGDGSRIVAALQSRRLRLLVLDNLDHVATHCAEVDAWSRAAAELRVLATSRAPAPLRDAHHVAVEPLTEEQAVRLFAERAAVAAPGFVVDAANRDVIGTLVQRLDLLPLAVELAAARTHILRPEQILERIDQRLAMLSDQRSGKSLAGALEWTWALLSPQEQDCLTQCAAFRGEFALWEAEALVEIQQGSVLDALDRLVSAGWLQPRRDGQGAELLFGFFESVHDFAVTKLEPKVRARFEARHAAQLTQWACEVAVNVETPAGLDAFRALVARESALRWALEFTGPGAAVRVVGAMEIAPWLGERVTREQFPEEVAAEQAALTTAIDAIDVAGRTERMLVLDSPRHALDIAGRDADLIVVGTRGRGLIAAELLGSVSTSLLHRQGVPVAIIPHHEAS